MLYLQQTFQLVLWSTTLKTKPGKGVTPVRSQVLKYWSRRGTTLQFVWIQVKFVWFFQLAVLQLVQLVTNNTNYSTSVKQDVRWKRKRLNSSWLQWTLTITTRWWWRSRSYRTSNTCIPWGNQLLDTKTVARKLVLTSFIVLVVKMINN